jgi:hypothetical protein
MQIQQKQARNQTERQVSALTREILGVYDDARRAINAELQAFYVHVLSGIDPKDYYNEATKLDRLNKLLAEIDKQYVAESVKAGTMTAESSRLAMSNAYYKNQFTLTWFTPNVAVGLDFTLLPPELVQLSVTGNLANWEKLSASVKSRIQNTFGSITDYIPKEGTLSSILANNRRSEVLKINRAISSGLLQGNSYQKTARSVSSIIGKVTPERSTGVKASALRIVRTESNRTYNAGAFANTNAAASQGVNVMRTILSVLDSRSRPQSIAIDDQTVGPNEPFTYPGGVKVMFPGTSGNPAWDINDRETVIDTIDGVKPQARTGVNPNTGETEVFGWQSYPEWAKANGLTERPSGRWS